MFHICCNSIFQMFYLCTTYVASKCFMFHHTLGDGRTARVPRDGAWQSWGPADGGAQRARVGSRSHPRGERRGEEGVRRKEQGVARGRVRV
jgi:hypothetical protein